MFYNFKAQYEKIQSQVQSNINNVLAHNGYVMGPEVAQLEEQLADYVGVNHCISVSSGTDALLVALLALGIGPGDEVITTPFSFIAVVEMLLLIGATPVFVDIDARTYNLDARKLKAAITDKTKAIVPVSLYGQPFDCRAINAIADEAGIYVIDDMAQSFGATAHGKRSGSLATVSCTSFYPTKPLGCYGDGGACFTDDAKLAARLRQIRDHGQSGRYEHTVVGITGRLDSIQAAILLAKLAIFDEEVTARQRIGQRYDELLADAAVVVPYIEPSNTSVYAQYTIQIDNRDACQAALKAEGIPTAVHYPTLLPDQPVVCQRLANKQQLATESLFPVAHAASLRVLSLPIHPYLTDAEIQRVSTAIKKIL